MKNFLRKNKLAWWLYIIFVFLFIGLIFFGIGCQRYYMAIADKESLQILADEKAAQVNLFLESQKEKINILSSMAVFKEAAMYPNDPAKIAIAKNRINELKSTLSRIAIFTKEGMMFIAGSGPTPIDYSALPYFTSKDKGIIFMRYYDEYQKNDYYSILGPIYDNIEKDNVIGAIAFNVELDKISSLMKEILESESNEVYLIDEAGLLLSGSKYIGNENRDGILVQEVKSEGAEECLEGLKQYGKEGFVKEHKEEIPSYLNYMGNKVFGAHAYVPAIMGCVIAEKGVPKILRFSLADYSKACLSMFNNISNK